MVLPADDPRLGDYLAMLRRRWRTVAAVALLVTAAGVAFSLLQPVEPTAKALISLTSALDDTPPDLPLEVAVLESALVADAADVPPGAEVAVAAVGDAPLLSVEVEAPDPEEAAAAANAYAEAYIDVRNARELRSLLAGQRALEARLEELVAPSAAAGGPAVDPHVLADLRLAADLLREAVTSGQLADVEAASEQLAGAAGGVRSEEALLAVRRAALQRLLDEVAVAVGQARAAGPQVAVPATADEVTGQRSLGQIALLSLLVGLVLGAAVALLRELRDVRVRRDELGRHGLGSGVLEWEPGRPELDDALRAALVLGLPEGGAVQVAPAGSVPVDGLVQALSMALRRGGRDAQVLDVRGGAVARAAEAAGRTEVTDPRFRQELRAATPDGGYLLVLSPTLSRPGDALVLASQTDVSIVAVAPGADHRRDVRAAGQALQDIGARVLVTVALADAAREGELVSG
jgi:hypothetical protein